MPADRVVESLDAIEHIGPGSVARPVDLARDPLGFQPGEEALHLGVAVAESLFNLPKRERIRRKTFGTREEARQDVFGDIGMFDNPTCTHLRNGMLSSVECEQQQDI